MLTIIAFTWAMASLAATCSANNSPISRPSTQPYPYNVGHAFPVSPARNKTCSVAAAGSGSDDSAVILKAFNRCNNGGTVVLDANYTIGTVLDLTFLSSVDVALSGSITFTDDIDYWTANSFKYAFQNSSSFLKVGGTDVNIYGGGVGVWDGNGQAWWDAFANDSLLLRPISLVIDGLQGGSVTGINMLNAPNWFNLIANSSDVLISDMVLTARSTSANPASNTDGWDIYRSGSVVLQDSTVDNDDDCVSFKPNTTNVVVQGLACNGSHGISVGSLGQYVGEYDIVENVYVYNNTMSNASDGARIKVWPGIDSTLEPSLSGGGGSGYVRNVTYKKYHNVNNNWAIELTQCYGQDNTTLCQLYPSNMTISEIYFLDFTGTTSSRYDPEVGTLICSSSEQCYDIYARNISVLPPSGAAPEWVCSGFNTSGLEGFNCTSAS